MSADFEIRNPAIEAKLKEIGLQMADAMPPGYGFTLLIFSYKDNEMFYLSSAERSSMIMAMREFIQKHEHN